MRGAWGRRSRRAIALVIAFVLSMLLAAAPAAAAVRRVRRAPPRAVPASVENFTYESFDADYYLVRGHRRKEPSAHDRDDRRAVPRVRPEQGHRPLAPQGRLGDRARHPGRERHRRRRAPIPWWTEEDEDWVYVLTGDDSYVRGAQTYVISYTMSDVVLRYEDTDADEFYWDTVGTDHPQPFGSVTAHVHIAGDAASGLLPDRRSATPGRRDRPTPARSRRRRPPRGRTTSRPGRPALGATESGQIGRRSRRAMSTSGPTRTSRSPSGSSRAPSRR